MVYSCIQSFCVWEGFFPPTHFLNWRKARETWHFYKNSEFVFVILQKSKSKYSKVRILQMNRVTAASSSLVTTNHNSVCTLLQTLILLVKKLGWLILNVHCNSIWIDYLSNLSNSISLQDPSSFKDGLPYFSKPSWCIPSPFSVFSS